MLIFQTVKCSLVVWFLLTDKKLALVLLCCHSPPAPGALCVTWNLQCVKLNGSCETFYRNQHVLWATGMEGNEIRRIYYMYHTITEQSQRPNLTSWGISDYTVPLTFSGLHANSISKAAQ